MFSKQAKTNRSSWGFARMLNTHRLKKIETVSPPSEWVQSAEQRSHYIMTWRFMIWILLSLKNCTRESRKWYEMKIMRWDENRVNEKDLKCRINRLLKFICRCSLPSDKIFFVEINEQDEDKSQLNSTQTLFLFKTKQKTRSDETTKNELY